MSESYDDRGDWRNAANGYRDQRDVLQARLDAALQIHRVDIVAADYDRRPTCIEDCDPWPCPTARALGVES